MALAGWMKHRLCGLYKDGVFVQLPLGSRERFCG